MHVVLISYEFPPITSIGGIGSYMYHLSNILTKIGMQVTVFSANPEAFELSIIKYPYCTNYLIPAFNNEKFRVNIIPYFEKYISENNIDFIESPEVGACALHVKELFPHIPLVVKLHTPGVLITKVNNTYLSLNAKLRFIAGAIIRGKFDLGYWAKYDKNRNSDVEYKICMIADKILSPSLALKNWAINFWGISSSKIILIPNPFSVNDLLFSYPLEKRPKIISFVGKLSILKGMNSLTKAIPLILQKNKDYKILLVGRNEIENGVSMLDYMQSELTDYKEQIIFTGPLDKLKLNDVYAASKVCIVPSLWENYPTVILEAMAAGSAVAASKRGGIPELINDKVNGVLFNPNKPNEIANAVNSLLSNEEKRIKIAQKAREDLFSMKGSFQFENDLKDIYSMKKPNIH